MNKIYTGLSVALMGAGCVLVPPRAESPESGSTEGVSQLPGALDLLYPPVAKAPVFLIGMIQLDSLFSGIVTDLSEGDIDGATASLAAFKARYREVADMIPDWRERYPLGPVEDLERAMRTGDRAAIVGACGDVGKLCHECHVATMVSVQQRYRWGSFQSISVRDPVVSDGGDYALFKRRLSANLSGIGHNLGQGQLENARRQFQQLKERIGTLQETCMECHDSEPRSYLDSQSDERLNELEAALAGESVRPEAVGRLLQRIGQESCSKCHLVHVPSAMSFQAKAY